MVFASLKNLISADWILFLEFLVIAQTSDPFIENIISTLILDRIISLPRKLFLVFFSSFLFVPVYFLVSILYESDNVLCIDFLRFLILT